jgi:spore coat polysaccharide biosynthesis predicted glycosyltransferase SpsG
MKVLILTEAGGNIGYGHMSRCISIFDELVFRGINAEMVVETFETFKDIFLNNSIKYLFWKNYQLDNHFLTGEYTFVVDSYNVNIDYLKYLKVNSKKLILIDDFGRIDEDTLTIINPSIKIEDLYFKTKNIFHGKEYIITRKEFVKNDNRIFGEKIKNILLLPGSAMNKEFYEMAVLLSINNPKLIITAIFPDSFLEGSCLTPVNLTIKSNLNVFQIIEEMNFTDFSITAGGQSIYELSITRTPFSVIYTAKNQISNLNGIISLNLSDIVIDGDSNNWYKKTMDILNQYNSIDKRKELVEIESKIHDGNGVKRIVDVILEVK